MFSSYILLWRTPISNPMIGMFFFSRKQWCSSWYYYDTVLLQGTSKIIGSKDVFYLFLQESSTNIRVWFLHIFNCSIFLKTLLWTNRLLITVLSSFDRGHGSHATAYPHYDVLYNKKKNPIMIPQTCWKVYIYEPLIITYATRTAYNIKSPRLRYKEQEK